MNDYPSGHDQWWPLEILSDREREIMSSLPFDPSYFPTGKGCGPAINWLGGDRPVSADWPVSVWEGELPYRKVEGYTTGWWRGVKRADLLDWSKPMIYRIRGLSADKGSDRDIFEAGFALGRFSDLSLEASWQSFLTKRGAEPKTD